MRKCDFTTDGYCIRAENDYCAAFECNGCSHSVTEVCTHDIAEIKVLDSVATCETTVIVCSNCGIHLSKPKTET